MQRLLGLGLGLGHLLLHHLGFGRGLARLRRLECHVGVANLGCVLRLEQLGVGARLVGKLAPLDRARDLDGRAPERVQRRGERRLDVHDARLEERLQLGRGAERRSEQRELVALLGVVVDRVVGSGEHLVDRDGDRLDRAVQELQLRHAVARELALEDDRRGHAHGGGDVVVDDAHEVHQVRARLGRAHARHHLLPVGAGEQVGRQRRRHVRRHG